MVCQVPVANQSRNLCERLKTDSGYAGKNPVEAAQMDMLVDGYKELLDSYIDPIIFATYMKPEGEAVGSP